MELKQHGSISLPFNVFFIEVRKLTGLKFTKYHSFRVRLIEGRINKSGGSRMPLEYCEHKPFTLEMPQAKINGNILYCPVDFLFKQLKLFKQTSCLSFSCKDKNKKEGKKESKKTVEKKYLHHQLSLFFQGGRKRKAGASSSSRLELSFTKHRLFRLLSLVDNGPFMHSFSTQH